LGKVGSYELKVTSAGKLQWILTNGVNSVTVTSTATIAANTWYHFAGVYNGDYTGTPQFGYTTQGSVQLAMPGDYYKGSPTGSTIYNLHANQWTAPEKGVLTAVVMDLQRGGDAALGEWIRAVVYADDAGSPGAKVAQSADQRIVGVTYPRQWITFPLSGPIYNLPYWLAWEAGESNQIAGIGAETTGGVEKYRRDERGSDSSDSHPTGDSIDPFGTVAGTGTNKYSMYATYTPTGRTGDEGKAVIYLNGQLDSSSSYAHGIADTANNLQHPAGVAVDLDDWAIFNKKLTAVQIATHYAAR
jgi:hypothetical protein